jgi:hypothetical protein
LGSPTPLLRKLQRNQVIEAIRAIELDPTEFDLDNGNTEFRIKHKWSESCFTIGNESGTYVGKYAVGDWPALQYEVYGWASVMPRVETWLHNVKQDLETPDLWAELQSAAELFEVGSGDPAENTPFTREEQEEIARQLQELAENAKREYSLSEPQMRVLNEKLSYLVDAAGRLGRTDWRGLAIGTMLSFVLSVALPPDAARHIFFSIIRIIGHRYGFPELGGG